MCTASLCGRQLISNRINYKSTSFLRYRSYISYQKQIKQIFKGRCSIHNTRITSLQHINELDSSYDHDLELEGERVVGIESSSDEKSLRTVDVDQDDPVTTAAWKKQQVLKILAFMAPAACLPLAEPILHLVDTVCIGQQSAAWSTLQLAALGPANVVFTFVQCVFQALQVSTIGLVTSSLVQGNKGQAEELLSSALVIAAVGGLLMGLVLVFNAEAVLRCTGLQDQTVLNISSSFLRWRSVGIPAMLMTMVCQSTFLAQKDSALPMAVVVLTGFFTLGAKLYFIGSLGGGLTQAAATTLFHQLVCAGVMLWAFRWRGELRVRPYFPILADVRKFIGAMGPLTFAYLFRNTTYVFFHAASNISCLTPASLAAHQAVYSLWSMLSFALAPLESAALAFAPASLNHAWHRKWLVRVLIVIAAAMGTGVGLTCVGMLIASPQSLCQDPEVIPTMISLAPQAGISLLLTAFDVASNGLNLACGDVFYVARSFGITFLSTSIMLALVTSAKGTLGRVWWVMVFFFVVRAAQSGHRVLTTMIGDTYTKPA